jgi:hypothetical protein
MYKENIELEGQFYAECARLLGADHTYTPWTGRGPNRWNNRHAGNGRFPGFGVIKMFAPNAIHVCLTHPKAVTRFVKSPEEAYALLR